MRAGGVVLSVSGAPVEDGGDLRNLVGTMESGTTLRLEVERDGKVKPIGATIRAKTQGERGEVHAVAAMLGRARQPKTTSRNIMTTTPIIRPAVAPL